MKETSLFKYSSYISYGKAIYLQCFEGNKLTKLWFKPDKCFAQMRHHP